MSKSDKSLDEQVDNMLIWDINGRKEPVIFKDEIKTAIKCLIQDNYISKAEHEKALVEARIEEVRNFTANNADCYDHIVDVYKAAKTRLAQLRKEQ